MPLGLLLILPNPILIVRRHIFAIAHAAYFANNKKLTNSELAKVKKIDPKWQTEVLFEGYIIGLESQEKATNFYVDYLKQYPDASEVRLEYAKLLTNQKKI